MPATTRHFGQLDSDYPPFATSGTYCEAVFPMKEVQFDPGFVLPREQRETAGSCGFATKTPSQAPSAPAWDLPSVVGTNPGLGDTTRFWSTLDSTLTGDGPRPGGWRQPAALRTRPAQGGGKKRKSKGKGKSGRKSSKRRTVRKHTKGKRGKGKAARRTRRTRRHTRK